MLKPDLLPLLDVSKWEVLWETGLRQEKETVLRFPASEFHSLPRKLSASVTGIVSRKKVRRYNPTSSQTPFCGSQAVGH